ncbi:MAG: hypothetical protein WAT79_14990 [Saprospiraceae bacterium]
MYLAIFQDISFNYEFSHVDSVLYEMVKNAIVHQDNQALKKAYTHFFLLPELSDHSENTEKYAIDAGKLLFKEGNQIIDWNLYYVLFRYYLSQVNGKKAIEMASKLQEKAQILSIPECTALSSLALGEAHDLNGNYKFAVSNLFNAHRQISNSTRIDIQRHVLAGISKFYQDHYMYENALTYKTKELELCTPKNLLDTIQFFHNQLDYQDIISSFGAEKVFDTEQVHKIISFAKKNHCRRLYLYATAFLRTKLAEIDNKVELNQYFQAMDVDEIQAMKSSSPYIFYLLSAFDYEEKNQIDKTIDAYKSALFEVEKTQSDDRKSYFHLQYAQFLNRINQQSEVGKHLEQAILLAKSAKNQEFEMNASLEADNFYSKHNNAGKAYEHLKNYYRLIGLKTTTSRDQDVYKMEILTEQKILENKKILEESFQERYNQVQYNLIAILIFSIFIVLLVSVKFKVPIWFIRVLGYMSVIFIFEFCIIQIDHFIHEVTHHTPWKVFSIKVSIISIILPLHHMIEKRLIRFLISRRESEENLIKVNTNIFKRWFKKLDSPDDGHE